MVVGARVQHIRKSSYQGTIISLDQFTCKVLFDEKVEPQLYWINRLKLVAVN